MNLLQLFLFILPAYIANSVPVLFSGKTPLDKGKLFPDGRRILGDGKTLRGFISGVFLGTIVGIPLSFFLGSYYLTSLPANDKIIIAFLLAFGALLGDLIGSFIKRREGIRSGEPFFLTDQLLFVITSLVLVTLAYPIILNELLLYDIIFLLAITFLLHVGFNYLAHKLHFKKVPW